MPEYVRVRDKETGHHYSIPRSRYDRDPDLYAPLKSPATHTNGEIVAPKHKTSVSAEAAKHPTTDGQTAESDKE